MSGFPREPLKVYLSIFECSGNERKATTTRKQAFTVPKKERNKKKINSLAEGTQTSQNLYLPKKRTKTSFETLNQLRGWLTSKHYWLTHTILWSKMCNEVFFTLLPPLPFISPTKTHFTPLLRFVPNTVSSRK